MQSCPSCAARLERPALIPCSSFTRTNCGTELCATIRFRALFLGCFGALAIALQALTLPVSNRVNVQKLSHFPFAVERFFVDALWRTPLVQLSVAPPKAAIEEY